MDFAQIKTKIPLNITKVDFIRNIIDAKLYKKIDVKALVIGLLCVFGFYCALYFYISVNANETIKTLESKLAYEVLPLKPMKAQPEINPSLETTNTEKMANTQEDLKIEGLYQNTTDGYLPVIRRNDNLTSFRAYQHPFTFENLERGRPVISFVVKDFGLSKEQSLKTLDILPSEISLILSPYAALPNEWMAMAREKGHEVWLSQPIQNKNAIDQGSHTIFHHAPYSYKLKSFFKTLTLTQGYLGVSSHTDETIEYVSEDYENLSEEVYTRGLGYLETNPDTSKIIETKSLTFGAPYIQADMELLRMNGDQSFDTLEHIAQKQGHIIVVVPNAPHIIKNLSVWILKVAQADYTLAPASAMFDLPLYQESLTSGVSEDSASTTNSDILQD